MQRNRPPSPQTVNVLRALAADPARWRYGYDLVTEVNLKSGSLYPILVRLADRGLLETSWEPSVDSRPPTRSKGREPDDHTGPDKPADGGTARRCRTSLTKRPGVSPRSADRGDRALP